MKQTLLVELFTEELPPKALAKLGAAFAAGVAAGLQARDLLEADAVVSSYASPRRLAVSITQVRAISPDKLLREKVLPVSVAIDAAGQPTAPLAKKLAAMGFPEVQLSELERAVDGKAESLFYSHTAAGTALAPALQAAIAESIAKLPIPKVMSYQRPDGETVHFVRPVHSILALHGTTIVPVHLLGLDSGRITRGHRFLSAGEISIAHADDYAAVLQEQGKVIASVEQRKQLISAALLAKAGSDLVLMPESLLDEVSALVEWPVVYECHFEAEFLSVPQECLILTMQTNQKYFALTDSAGKLRSRFLIVSNLATDDPRFIIEGNERVVRPRLSDAKFFFEQDKKKTLAARLPLLANVVYHNKLGSQAERTERVQVLAGKIAAALGTDVALAQRAALLAKTDLLTDMVGEFPELQGIMGTYYALHDGEPADVAAAASEHYQPRFSGDALPASMTGTVVALADKLETLVGIWGIGLQPTGDRDPFALRRHALGILRMLVEKRLPLSLTDLLSDSAAVFAGNAQFRDPSAEVLNFLYERLRGLLRGYDGTDQVIAFGNEIRASINKLSAINEIEAIVAQQPDTLANIVERLAAVQAFAALPESLALAAANKRITNILKKADSVPSTVDASLLSEVAEQALAAAMARVKPGVDAAYAAGDFTAALKMLAALRAEVDSFFNDVMVNADDLALRNNRLALLASLHLMLNQVADISKLAA
ncbi:MULTISPECIES: glycine--tRNA ligase subunit beta [unclassified Undibacterium]|uniref:glycine--tRNA ligase subunit beta n=1 Tax=unclassified Undibacterium TaxID=2630295 RepID=UPI002AC8B6AD|nr:MULTISPECIES: glycine--tRNA ligase subunit beta [unclassified Undibacterium]MEB0139272.1 glycine--tRNA ligase subunit beta [Undibacterium sp. CCC2.1]MEB0172116.1 glycine--tRNA ligase subunit beta [Undibacterium sp. CCC1.1]MEB0175991.1 glycine--tRNA ligase subunit beta [Undibacterium sp. CCC3.4]MEB0215303.1 glycine--tRNA ligase subunit beta [Undibacterium sp. 5I2]WPX45477.1 glycine--tRNA ligase subunit beta [Undibacterium sp. CCC3.4]